MKTSAVSIVHRTQHKYFSHAMCATTEHSHSFTTQHIHTHTAMQSHIRRQLKAWCWLALRSYREIGHLHACPPPPPPLFLHVCALGFKRVSVSWDTEPRERRDLEFVALACIRVKLSLLQPQCSAKARCSCRTFAAYCETNHPHATQTYIPTPYTMSASCTISSGAFRTSTFSHTYAHRTRVHTVRHCAERTRLPLATRPTAQSIHVACARTNNFINSNPPPAVEANEDHTSDQIMFSESNPFLADERTRGLVAGTLHCTPVSITGKCNYPKRRGEEGSVNGDVSHCGSFWSDQYGAVFHVLGVLWTVITFKEFMQAKSCCAKRCFRLAHHCNDVVFGCLVYNADGNSSVIWIP